MSLSVTVRVLVRHLSPSSTGILPMQSLFVNGVWLPDVWALDTHVCAHAFIKRLYISECYLKDSGPTHRLPNRKPSSCSCCNNLSLLSMMVPQQITKLLKGCMVFLPFQVQWQHLLVLKLASFKSKTCLGVTLYERILQSSK